MARANTYELLNDFATTHSAKSRVRLLAHLRKHPMTECFFNGFDASIVRCAREQQQQDIDAGFGAQVAA